MNVNTVKKGICILYLVLEVQKELQQQFIQTKVCVNQKLTSINFKKLKETLNYIYPFGFK